MSQNKSLKNFLKKQNWLLPILRPVYSFINNRKEFNSRNYWEERYQKKGDSGDGSYGRLAEFKAEFINDFVKKNHIQTVIEFGCGDGNQVEYFSFPKYVGLDVSSTSIKMCLDRFEDDKGKSFFLYDSYAFSDNIGIFNSDLSMSIDVIYHLVEDGVFERYMKNLFDSSSRWVIIYSSDTKEQGRYQAKHLLHRRFTDWIKENRSSWKFHTKVENKIVSGERVAHFFIYRKM